MRRLAWFTVVSLATLGVLFLLWEFRGAVFLFVLSLVVAATVRPLSERLSRTKLSTGWALILIYAAGLSLIAILSRLFGPSLLDELRRLGNELNVVYELIKSEWPEGTSVQQMMAERLPPSTRLYDAIASEQGVTLARVIFGVTAGVFSVIGQTLIVLVLSIHWGISRTRFERLWLSLLPAEKRVRARDIWRDIETNTGAYIRSEVAQSLLATLLLGVGFWWIGVEYPTLLAILGGILWLIPVLGGLLTIIAAILVGLLSGLPLAVLAGVYTLVVFSILETAIEPRLYDRRRFSSFLLVLLMLLLVNDLGFLGLITAPPLAVAIQLFFKNLMRQTMSIKPQLAPQMADLQQQVAALHTLLSDLKEPAPAGIASMVDRLDHLVEQANKILAGEEATEEPDQMHFSSSPAPEPEPAATIGLDST